MEKNQQDVTYLLMDWQSGNSDALKELTPLVYQELKKLARSAFIGENSGHTLQPTALINEAFEVLVGIDVDWKNRGHFYSLSARLMRRILVDHAKSSNALKRGGDFHLTSFTNEASTTTPTNPTTESTINLLALDEAIEQLARIDQRKADVIELNYFGGLTFDEIANSLEISTATVDRDLRFAKAWLEKCLKEKL